MLFQDYQILTDIARRTATESYIYAFKAKFGFSPWKLMEKHDILRDSTRLKFGKICDNFVFKDNEIKQINSKINIEIFTLSMSVPKFNSLLSCFDI